MAALETHVGVADSKPVIRVGVITVSTVVTQPVLY